MKSYEEEEKALKEEIIRDRYDLAQSVKKENIFKKIIKKLLTLFK